MSPEPDAAGSSFTAGKRAAGREQKATNSQERRKVGREDNSSDGQTGGSIPANKAKDDRQPGPSKRRPMREAKDVIHRIQWDPNLDVRDFVVGYLDRFVGVVEKPFSEFTWQDLCNAGPNVLSIPQHRIQYFKCRDVVIWSKLDNFDDVFGSRGTGKTIDQVVMQNSPINEQNIGPKTRVIGDQEPTPQGGPEGEDGGDADGDGDEDEEDSEEADPLPQHTRYTKANARRPNYFVCFRVCDPRTREAVQEVQQWMISSLPILHKGCLPVLALHITLCTLKLRNEEELGRAEEVLHSFRPQLVSLLPQNLPLTFEGVDTFRDRLLFVTCKEEKLVATLGGLLRKRFEDAGLATPGNHGDFKPHMTFLRLSRPMCKEMGTNFIDRGLHAPFATKHFGQQCIDGIHLCSMTQPHQSDGFLFASGYCQ